MTDETNANLEQISGELKGIDRSLQALTAQVQNSAGSLAEELTETLLDRLDEMMDLLYLLDDRLAGLLGEA